MIRLLALAVLAFVAAPVAAQPERGGRVPWVPPKDVNFELFRGLLHFYGIVPVKAAELAELRRKEDYKDLIVIIIGCSTRGESDRYAVHVDRALKNGGAVLIASDLECDLSYFFPEPVVAKVDGGIVTPARGESLYFNELSLPVLYTSRAVGQQDDPTLNLFAPLPGDPNSPLQLVANRPSVLDIRKRTPALAHDLAFAVQQRRPPSQNDVVTVVAGGVGPRGNPYRCIALADQDILSNAMLYASGQPDRNGVQPGNWVFANRLVKDFLREPNERTRCLFVEYGNVVERFDDVELKSVQQMSPIPPVPLPNPLDRRVQAKMAELIDNSVEKLEERNTIGNRLAGSPTNSSGRRFQIVTTVLAMVAGVVLVVLMARRLWGTWHKKNFVPAPSDPLFLGDETTLGSFGQRRAELLRGTDFRAPFAHQVRTIFAERGLPAGHGRRRLPPVEFRVRRDREQLGEDIHQLWDAASRDEALPLSYVEWKDLEPVLAEVHAAAVAERWRFAPSFPQGPA